MDALPISLRTHLIVYGAECTIQRHDGFWSVVTPGNPTFFWGNFLHFDAAPTSGDVERWSSLFDSHVRTSQLSRHTAFSWEGSEPGATDSFVQRGYQFL
ncbi:MAG: hypothetical protein ABI580_07420, partial [Burkholderiaceae bacterium]